MAFFDPNLATPGFAPPGTNQPTRVDPEVAMKQALLLRKRAEMMREGPRSQSPQGEMVSGIYVRPHWSQQLAPVVSQLLGGYYEGKAGRDEAAAQQASQRQAAEWIGGVPQAATQQVPFQAPGIDEADAAAAGAGATVGQQVAPSRATVLKHAMAGMNNPLTRGVAEQYLSDQLIKEPVREEERQFKSEEAKAARVDRMEQVKAQMQARAEELRMRLEDRGLDRASREQMAAEMRALTGGIARMNDQTRRDLAQLSAETRTTVAGQKPQTPVSPTVVKTLGGLRQQAEALNDVSGSFKPEYGDLAGGVGGTVGGFLPKSMGGDKYRAATDWWKNYENSAALVERHEKFGTALSAGERQAWQKATIAPGMSADTIKQNLATRAELAKKVYNQSVDEYSKTGHRVDDAFPKFGEPPRESKPAPAAAPTVTTTTKVKGPVGLDTDSRTIGGKTYVKRNGQWFEQ